MKEDLSDGIKMQQVVILQVFQGIRMDPNSIKFKPKAQRVITGVLTSSLFSLKLWFLRHLTGSVRRASDS